MFVQKKIFLGWLVAATIPIAQAFEPSSSDRWVEPISFDSKDKCIDPMIKMRGQYTIGQDGLDGLVGFFVAADINKDNKVCIDEVERVNPDAIALWSSYDRNGDRCITPAEARESLEAIMLAQWLKDFSGIDGNRNEVLETHELENRFGNKPDSMTPSEIMGEYDLNFDGAITRLEYVQRSVMALQQIRATNPKLTGIKTKGLSASAEPPFQNGDPLKKGIDQSNP